MRALASYQFTRETATVPSLNGSIGVQGIGTGNPGYSLTAEKNWRQASGALNAFAGIGLRSNEDHAHLVAGVRYQFSGGLALGVQADGHETSPFAVYSRGNFLAGFYLVGGSRPAYLLGARF